MEEDGGVTLQDGAPPHPTPRMVWACSLGVPTSRKHLEFITGLKSSFSFQNSEVPLAFPARFMMRPGPACITIVSWHGANQLGL